LIDPKIIDDLAKRFAESVPPGLRQIQAELEKNFHAVLQATFAKMDLVTREEFDVQQAVLARTRSKLEALEKQVAELEAQQAASARQAAPQPTRKATTGPRKKTKTSTEE
jgi:BMFP domain-containing protein YqiC